MPSPTIPTREPVLLKLTFVLPTNRETGKTYGTTAYSSNGSFVYKRCSHPIKRYEYFRVSTGKVFHMTYWYEIPIEMWEPVDVYGIPTVVRPPSE